MINKKTVPLFTFLLLLSSCGGESQVSLSDDSSNSNPSGLISEYVFVSETTPIYQQVYATLKYEIIPHIEQYNFEMERFNICFERNYQINGYTLNTGKIKSVVCFGSTDSMFFVEEDCEPIEFMWKSNLFQKDLADFNDIDAAFYAIKKSGSSDLEIYSQYEEINPYDSNIEETLANSIPEEVIETSKELLYNDFFNIYKIIYDSYHKMIEEVENIQYINMYDLYVETISGGKEFDYGVWYDALMEYLYS